MNKLKSPSDEQKSFESLDADEYESVLTDERRQELEAAASHTFKKDKGTDIGHLNR